MPTLHWLDRDQTLSTATNVPCRILRPDDSLSCGVMDSGNMLIQGDNLHTLSWSSFIVQLLRVFRG